MVHHGLGLCLSACDSAATTNSSSKALLVSHTWCTFLSPLLTKVCLAEENLRDETLACRSKLSQERTTCTSLVCGEPSELSLMVSQSLSRNHLIQRWDHFVIHQSFLYIFSQAKSDSVPFKGQSGTIPRQGTLTKYWFCQEGPSGRGGCSGECVAASSQYLWAAPDGQTAGK